MDVFSLLNKSGIFAFFFNSYVVLDCDKPIKNSGDLGKVGS